MSFVQTVPLLGDPYRDDAVLRSCLRCALTDANGAGFDGFARRCCSGFERKRRGA